MEISEVKVRNEFFVSALFVESTITDYLSEKLNIADTLNSEFLGNHQNAISFDQKIDALLDSLDFSIIDKSKISVFRGIYKEFMLNQEALTLEGSFQSPDHNDDFLLILYPQNDYLPREEKLINACYQLIGEVSELVADKTRKPEVKLSSRSRFFNLNNFSLGKIAMTLSLLFVS